MRFLAYLRQNRMNLDLSEDCDVETGKLVLQWSFTGRGLGAIARYDGLCSNV